MKDFLGKEITKGDKCIFLKNTNTGSSTTRKIMYKGVVLSATGKPEVEFHSPDQNRFMKRETTKVFASEIVIVDWE